MLLYVRLLSDVALPFTLRLCVAAWPTLGGDLQFQLFILNGTTLHKSFFDHLSRLTEPPNKPRQTVKLQPFTSSRPKAAAVVKCICHLTVMSLRHCCAYSNTVEMECVLMVSSFIVKHLKGRYCAWLLRLFCGIPLIPLHKRYVLLA